jgi:hypothetical protein
LQAQQSPIAEIAKHPSAVSHPALSDQPVQRGGGDNSIVYIFGGLLLGGIPLSYWYWGYRERAMTRKKEEGFKRGMLLGMVAVEENEAEGCNLRVCLDSRGKTRNSTIHCEPDITQGR